MDNDTGKDAIREYTELDNRADFIDELVPINHPFGVWVEDYNNLYMTQKGLKLESKEDVVRFKRFMRAKMLGAVHLFKITLVDMGRIMFGSYQAHENFAAWLYRQEYNPDYADNTQDIIDNEKINRAWYEGKTGVKFSG